MSALTVKTKLLIVAFLSAAAVVAVGTAGGLGIGSVSGSLDRVAHVRLPSIIGLETIRLGQLDVRVLNREAPIHENDYAAQAKFADIARKKAIAFARVDKGWKLYEPLPQEPEEAQVWKQFEAAWADWRRVDAELTRTVEALAANRTEAGQKELFRTYYAQLATINKPYAESERLLGRLVELNEGYARADTTRGDAAIAYARTAMVAVAVVAIVLVLLASLLIVRDLTRALGGEPGYAAEVARRIAEGDLVSPVAVRVGDRTSLLAAMATMRGQLAQVVGRINEASGTIHTAASEIATGNQDLASRTEEQASSLQQTASSMEELTTTVRQSADNAQQADRLAASASSVAARGGEAVSQVVETMAAIHESSRRIADIIGVIDGIAFQTNILALNAAVEAARAGEQGRGFAVVASEVRTLAQRSAEAAREIKTLIGDSVGKVESGSRLVDQAGTTIAEVVSSVQRVTGVMSEITTASREQSTGIGQVNDAVVQMDKVTQQNAALVEQAAAAAESMRKQADELRRLVSVFRVVEGAAPAATVAMAEAGPRANVVRLPSLPAKATDRGARRQVSGSDVSGNWTAF